MHKMPAQVADMIYSINSGKVIPLIFGIIHLSSSSSINSTKVWPKKSNTNSKEYQEQAPKITLKG